MVRRACANGGSKAQSRKCGSSSDAIDIVSDPLMMNGDGKRKPMPWLQKQTVNEQSAATGNMRLRLQQAGDKQLSEMSEEALALPQQPCVGMMTPTQQAPAPQFPVYQQEFPVPVGLQCGGPYRGPSPAKVIAPEMRFQQAAVEHEQMPTRTRGNFCPPAKQTLVAAAAPWPAAVEHEQMPTRTRGNFCPPVTKTLSAAAAPWVPAPQTVPWTSDQVKRKPAAPKGCIHDMPLPKFLFASAATSPGSLSPADLTPRSITPPPGLLQPPGLKTEEDDWIFIAMGDEDKSTEGPLSEDESTSQDQSYTQWKVPAQYESQWYGQAMYDFDPNATTVHMKMSF